MKLSSPSSLPIKLVLIMLISLLVACTGPGTDDTEDVFVLPKYLGFVEDAENQPVAFATVGKTEIATEDGVASGDFEEFEGEWIPVEAPGYASSYANSLNPVRGHNFFVSTLTPYENFTGVWEEGDSVLSATLDEEIIYSVLISSSQFTQEGVVVGLAAIDRMDVSPGRVSHRADDGLRLRAAFAVEAFEGVWEPVQLETGASIPITIELVLPLSDEAVFAVFDPVLGAWVEKDLGCTTDDGLILSCRLPELNPLWGIFDQKENFMIAESLNNISHNVGLSSPPIQEGGNQLDEFNLAYDAWNQFMIDNLDSGLDFESPVLLTLLKNMEKAAKKYAEKNRTEGAKKVLMKGAEAASWTGHEQISDSLADEAGEISEEIMKDLLKDVSCGEQRKLLKGAEQNGMLNYGSKSNDDVMDKLGDITADCDVWVGTIKVMMITARNHPADLPLSGQGGGWWMEFHKVKLWTDVKTFEMHGESFVRQVMPPVTYVNYDPCLTEITMYGAPGEAIIDYAGTYDGVEFKITSTDVEGGGHIYQIWDFNDLDDNESCKNVTYINHDFGPYYSVIVHGVVDETPPINLQEMLETGNKGTYNKMETIRGNEPFLNPSPDMGKYPFLDGDISWSFIHAEKRLPKETQ